MKERSPTSSEEARAIKSSKQLKMESTGQLYNEAAEYKTFGYDKAYMLRKWETFVSGEKLDQDTNTYTSKQFDCTPFSHFIFYLDAVCTLDGCPVLQVEVQYSPDGNQWYDLQDGVFGTMTIPVLATPLKQCFDGVAMGRYMRVMLYSNILRENLNSWIVTASAEFLQP